MILPEILRTAIIAGVVIAIIAYIADWFAGKASLGFPRQMIWLIAFAIWLLVVFFGGSLAFR
jgi:hypothetical protein